jgi:signal transduction histidine kinase
MITELWRITSFRLTVLYGSLFALAVAGLLTLVYAETARYKNGQVDQNLTDEIRAFAKEPESELLQDIAYEIKLDLPHIYSHGLFTPDGRPIAGNLSHAPRGLPLDGKPHALPLTGNGDLFHQEQGIRIIGQKLASGNFLVVARDLTVLDQVRQELLHGYLMIGGVILLLGVMGGVFYSLPAVRHIREIDNAARRIGAGDYSERLPLGKRNPELVVLARIVNAMLDETERLMGEVKSYSDNIAHEMRTPLTRLRGSVYRSQQQAGEDAAIRPMLDHALTQIDILLTRFRALSRISEIEGKRRRAGFSEAKLDLILRAVIDLYEPLASQGDVRLTLEIQPGSTIECDGELLIEAIGNLVDNAIKFTPPTGSVRLALEATPKGPVISISDSGPGIAPDQRKQVFQRFYRIPATLNIPGSGLGLSMVDAIARLHGFALTLDDSSEGGTRVRLHCWQQGAGV